jgi:hypothetical protein
VGYGLIERGVLELGVELVVDCAEPLAHDVHACDVLDDTPEAERVNIG